MSNWVTKSFCLVEEGHYLDRIADIYQSPVSSPNHISEKQKNLIIEAFKLEDSKLLEIILTSFKRFPFNDPFVSFLRKKPDAIENNPKTTKRICNQLRNIGVNGVIKGLERPKEFNRQMGALFINWLRKEYNHNYDSEDFVKTKENPIFLDLSGEKLRLFANQIGCGIQKQPDFIFKSNNKFIIGEAKFIGTEGGNQNRAFDDALKLASSSFKEAITVAILDGYIWIPNSGQMSLRLKNFSGNALTSLLLDSFLSSI